ncbi:hypothetical protein CE91St41_34310 [Oscillospiraceae bacterium]|nr:hypothetical protein CE91St40_34300 [Oscillospiraceae bacterium]BDF76542.1 hypothetical protein CE91St41_34310 [Oscillospiraceae bacterium]
MSNDDQSPMEPAAPPPPSLGQIVGARCELRSQEDNSLVFLGRIQGFDGRAVTVYAAAGGEVPPVIYNTPFKLVIRAPGRSALVWRGKICGSARGFWKLDQLSVFHYAEHRAHFRQPVSLPARVLCINSLHGSSPRRFSPSLLQPCRVMDVSLSGVRLRCREAFVRGDWLLLTGLDLLSDGEPPFAPTCRVCWADRLQGNEFLFGCSFSPMGLQEQDRLCAAIFTLQRRDIFSHRKD